MRLIDADALRGEVEEAKEEYIKTYGPRTHDGLLATSVCDGVMQEIDATPTAEGPKQNYVWAKDSNIVHSAADDPLVLFLALYIAAPENAPEDWWHRVDENHEAWRRFILAAESRGYYTLPCGEEADHD